MIKRSRLVLALSTLAVGAAASMSVVLPAPAAQPPSKDCILDVSTGAQQCFGDFRAAMRFATGGAVTDAPLSAREAVTDQRFRAQIDAVSLAAGEKVAPRSGSPSQREAAGVIGATLYTGTGFSGQSETLMIPRPCVKDGKYDYGFELGTIGRAAESVEPWANCWVWLHSGDTWDSPRQGPFKEDTSDLGDWKGRAVLMALS
ncbi:MAG TPA: hypothetical protein VI248_17465 [Kineosporiaceae bacterium]